MGTADNDGKEDIWTGSTAVKGQVKEILEDSGMTELVKEDEEKA